MASRVFHFLVPPLLSMGIQALLRDHPDLEFGGEFVRMEDLVPAVQSERGVCTVVTDFLGDVDLYQRFLHELRAAHDNVRVIFLLSAFFDEPLVLRAVRAGADGYALQSASPETLLRALKTVSEGQSFLEPVITPLILSELRKPMFSMRPTDTSVQLSERERMLLQLAADGLSNAQIADVLALAEKTVRNLWSSLFEKLNMNDRTQAVLWAIRTGLTELR